MFYTNQIIQVYPNSLRANTYTTHYFRMIGLIDVMIDYYYGVEKVTLSFYSSSGTNNGKIKWLWYPIVGIKTSTGPFTEFSPCINTILTYTTYNGTAQKGWLAKSLFFYNPMHRMATIDGFSYGNYQQPLYEIGKLLSTFYTTQQYYQIDTLDATLLNSTLLSNQIYKDNLHSQRENYEHFITDIYNGI